MWWKTHTHTDKEEKTWVKLTNHQVWSKNICAIWTIRKSEAKEDVFSSTNQFVYQKLVEWIEQEIPLERFRLLWSVDNALQHFDACNCLYIHHTHRQYCVALHINCSSLNNVVCRWLGDKSISWVVVYFQVG